MSLFSKIASFSLAVAVLLGCSACAGGRGEQEGTAATTLRTGLVVEESPFDGYNGEERASYCGRIAVLLQRVLYLYEGYWLHGEAFEDAKDAADAKVLPVLEELKLSPTEVEEMLFTMEALCDRAEGSNGANAPLSMPSLMLSAYGEGVTLLGNGRSGMLLYGFVNLWLDEQIGICEERYQKYGYQWYLEDAERFREQKRLLTEELGGERFTVTVSFFFLTAVSLSDGLGGMESGFENLLNPEELLTLLQWETNYFRGQDMTDEQWSLGIELITEWLLEDGSLTENLSTILSAELSALLGTPAIYSRLGKTVASLLHLYEEEIRALDEADMHVLLGEDKNAALALLCRTVGECEDTFFEFCEILEANMISHSEAEEAALRQAGVWEEYQAYADAAMTVSSEELFLALSTYGRTASEHDRSVLFGAAEGYAFSIAPYLIFAINSALQDGGADLS